MPDAHRLTVNGRDHEVRCPDDTPLLWVLRDRLGLTGTRYGCGVGSCGACTVWVDGQPTHSCDTPIWSAAGKSVVTVEGLTEAGPHPVQRRLIDGQAGQCGYCLSGIVMRAAALLDEAHAEGRHVEGDEVRAALDGHLCRCGAHNRIVDAVVSAGGE